MSTEMSELALQEWPWQDLAAKDAELERLTAERDQLRAALEAIVTRFKDCTDLSLQVATDIAEGALVGPPHQRP